MHNRFKFRTWNPDLNFFTYWGWMDKGEYKNFCSCREISKDELLEKYTQQCTAMKDDNGNLIYEGDIVKIWKFPNINKTCLVKWRDTQCSFRLYDIKHMGATPQKLTNKISCRDIRAMGAVSSINIIGNIYENPELLKDGDNK